MYECSNYHYQFINSMQDLLRDPGKSLPEVKIVASKGYIYQNTLRKTNS